MSLSVCILRYQLWDIDIIINRTLVYSVLSAWVIAVYILIVGLLGNLFHTDDNLLFSLMATGIVAVSFHTLQDRIQQTINRLMFGHRDDPYIVLERLAQQLEPVTMVNDVLPTIVQAIAQALKLPYAAIVLERDGEDQIAASTSNKPIPLQELVKLPLVYQSDLIGFLQLAPRSRGETFSDADMKLLGTIAQQTSIAAYNVRLTTDLQRSREELVTTREEERRRLRRDLHDGLGPVMASMSFRLDAIYNMTDQNPDQAKAPYIRIKGTGSIVTLRNSTYCLQFTSTCPG